MSIKPLNNHYSFTASPSVYDEEAMTALELASRTTAKVNETVNAFNMLETETTERLSKQDADVDKMINETMPAKVDAEVNDHIKNGDFDQQISKYSGNLQARVDNLLESTPEGSTTMDAEIIDIRVAPTNDTYPNAGEAVREQIKAAMNAKKGLYNFSQNTINSADAAVMASNTRVLSSVMETNSLVYIRPAKGYNIKLFGYSANMEMVEMSEFNRYPVLVNREIDAPFVRFLLAKTDNSDLLIENLTGNEVELFTVEAMEKNGYKKVDNLPMGQGTIAQSGVINYRDNRVYSPLMKADFRLLIPDVDYLCMCFFYDGEFNLVGKSADFQYEPIGYEEIPTNAEYVRIAVRKKDNPVINYADGCPFTIYTADTNVFERSTVEPSPFVHEMMNIAYSSVGLGMINTAPHFRAAAHLGVNALKGDVEITFDNGLIMCHDAGVTLDSNGRITDFDNSNYSAFADMTFDEATSLEFASEIGYRGYRFKLCTFDEYVRICAETGKIAYITLRNTKIPELVKAVFDTLYKYDMVDRCIINSYTYATLQTVRTYSASVPVSQVLNHKYAMTRDDVERILGLGNSIVTLFYYPLVPGDHDPDEAWAKSLDAVNYAHERGLIVHDAQVNNYADYLTNLKYGVKGMHLTSTLVPYQREKVTFYVVLDDAGNVSYKPYWNKIDRFTPTLSKNGNTIVIDNFKRYGSDAEYDDGLPMYWFNYLPYQITVDQPHASIKKVGNTIELYTEGVPAWYAITIEI